MEDESQEIHKIVSQVNESYWPRGLKFIETSGQWVQYTPHGTWPVWEDAVRLMFEADFTNHIIGHGFHTFEWDHDEDTDLVTLNLYDRIFTGKDGLEALCSALIDIDNDKFEEKTP